MMKNIKGYLFKFWNRFFYSSPTKCVQKKIDPLESRNEAIQRIKQVKRQNYDGNINNNDSSTITQVENYIKKQKKINKEPFNPIKNKQNTVINRPSLMRNIKKNIFYLNELLEALVGKKYRAYHLKVSQLKEQSEQSFAIVLRMKDNAPYLHSTLQSIAKHTKAISFLINTKLS